MMSFCILSVNYCIQRIEEVGPFVSMVKITELQKCNEGYMNRVTDDFRSGLDIPFHNNRVKMSFPLTPNVSN